MAPFTRLIEHPPPPDGLPLYVVEIRPGVGVKLRRQDARDWFTSRGLPIPDDLVDDRPQTSARKRRKHVEDKGLHAPPR
jgi:hypothetical protein